MPIDRQDYIQRTVLINKVKCIEFLTSNEITPAITAKFYKEGVWWYCTSSNIDSYSGEIGDVDK